MNQKEFMEFLVKLDRDTPALPREPHVEQTKRGRYLDLFGYFRRYGDARFADEQARATMQDEGLWD